MTHAETLAHLQMCERYVTVNDENTQRTEQVSLALHSQQCKTDHSHPVNYTPLSNYKYHYVKATIMQTLE